MKTYREYLVTADPFVPEVLSSILWELNIVGINEDVDCLKIFATDPEVKESDICAQLEKLKKENMVRSYKVETNVYEDKNWNEEWEKSINVVEVSDKIIIKPTFRTYEAKPGQLVLTIDPKMSFGTGEHQTTKLCLMMVDKYIKPDMRMLDVGTGTAVLAIAAVKLGASHALAIDNDEWCFDNGVENCALNNTGDLVEIRTSVIEETPEKDFDIVTANIQKNILLSISKELYNRMKPDAVLILSGLLKEDEEDIKKHYTEVGFDFLDTQTLEAWISVVFKKA